MIITKVEATDAVAHDFLDFFLRQELSTIVIRAEGAGLRLPLHHFPVLRVVKH